MPKNVGISEGGSPRGLSGVRRILMPDGSGTYSAWVPRDERQTIPKYITKNGTYLSKDDHMHGYTPITVNVAGGMDGVTPAPVGGIGCSVIGIDPSTGLVKRLAVAPDGRVREVDDRAAPRNVEPSAECENVVKYKFMKTFVGHVGATSGYAEGNTDCWDHKYDSGVVRNSVHSVITVGFTAICQSHFAVDGVYRIHDVMTKDIASFPFGGYFPYGDADKNASGQWLSIQTGQSQAAYRFDPIMQTTYSETARCVSRVIDARLDIAISPPKLRNPVWAYTRKDIDGVPTRIYGMANVEVTHGMWLLTGLTYGKGGTHHSRGLLGTHFGRWEGATKDAQMLLDGRNNDWCTLEVTFDTHPNIGYASITPSAMPPILRIKAYDVMTGANFIRSRRPRETFFLGGYNEDNPLFDLQMIADGVEYCGPISEAPESAFILD